MGFINEFKKFAIKGNVMDLAVGVIIGGAFNKIVTALVGSVIMPVISMIIGSTEQFKTWSLGGIMIGELLQAILDFMIIAFVLFLMLKGINRLRMNTVTEVPPPPKPTKSELYLEEIRNLLKKD